MREKFELEKEIKRSQRNTLRAPRNNDSNRGSERLEQLNQAAGLASTATTPLTPDLSNLGGQVRSIEKSVVNNSNTPRKILPEGIGENVNLVA